MFKISLRHHTADRYCVKSLRYISLPLCAEPLKRSGWCRAKGFGFSPHQQAGYLLNKNKQSGTQKKPLQSKEVTLDVISTWFKSYHISLGLQIPGSNGTISAMVLVTFITRLRHWTCLFTANWHLTCKSTMYSGDATLRPLHTCSYIWIPTMQTCTG